MIFVSLISVFLRTIKGKIVSSVVRQTAAVLHCSSDFVIYPALGKCFSSELDQYAPFVTEIWKSPAISVQIAHFVEFFHQSYVFPPKLITAHSER